MPLTDPQYVVRRYFDQQRQFCAVNDGNITDERGVPVSFCAVFAMGEMLLFELFHQIGYDLVFVVGKPRTDTVLTASGPIAYRHTVRVTPTTIDKWGGNDQHYLVAQRILDRAAKEVRRVIRENMTGSLRLTGQETAEHQRLGSMILWGRGIDIMYTQPVTSY
jgi:hypothetical protein